MSKIAPDRVWMTVDVPRDVAEAFAGHAKQQHRSVRGQLRVLVEEFLNQQEPAGGTYTGRTAAPSRALA